MLPILVLVILSPFALVRGDCERCLCQQSVADPNTKGFPRTPQECILGCPVSIDDMEVQTIPSEDQEINNPCPHKPDRCQLTWAYNISGQPIKFACPQVFSEARCEQPDFPCDMMGMLKNTRCIQETRQIRIMGFDQNGICSRHTFNICVDCACGCCKNRQ